MPQRRNHPYIPGAAAPDFNYCLLTEEPQQPCNIGGEKPPPFRLRHLDGNMDFNPQFMPDYSHWAVSCPNPAEGVQYIIDADLWKDNQWPAFKENSCRLSADARIAEISVCHGTGLNGSNCRTEIPSGSSVITFESNHPNRLGEYRQF